MKRLLACFLLMLLFCSCGSSSKLTEMNLENRVQLRQEEAAEKINTNSFDLKVQTMSACVKADSSEWWQKAFQLDPQKQQINSAKLYRYSDQVNVSVMFSLGENDSFTYLNALSPVEADDVGRPLRDLSVLEIVLESDVKYTYQLYERGVVVSKLSPGPGGKQLNEDYGKQKRLAVDEKAYQTLLSCLRTRMEEGRWASSWLSLMRQTNAERIFVTSSDGNQVKEYNREDLNKFLQIFSDIQGLSIEPNTCCRVSPDTKLKSAAHVQIDFYNGIHYDIWHNETNILVASSDMDYALLYKTKQAWKINELNQYAQGMIAPLTGKPVIYLYPEKPTEVSVKVHYKGNFTYTYPTYLNGWRVTAYPDGRLINKTDGSEHYYLFWEGNTAIDWKFNEGFVVKGSEAEQFFVEKLSYMGLTPREYNDFIVYWLPEIQRNEYNLITFSTEQYEELAPLEISPQPDRILRVHMVYKKLNQPIKIKPQTLKPFERKGFTVVEWGGSRA